MASTPTSVLSTGWAPAEQPSNEADDAPSSILSNVRSISMKKVTRTTADSVGFAFNLRCLSRLSVKCVLPSLLVSRLYQRNDSRFGGVLARDLYLGAGTS